ncbi:MULTISPECIES: hypothetical protein [Photorhabdus]|uniref:Periplasmic protein n=2 Tax=Photorhabdus asymbiotica TaxID=291112 RepID=C7BMX6_PHOAA|nr:hypothetical protein [Photorhabdus asymbiotica]RKS57721.1 hypothetical protein BDD30_2532 [Photorhabdus asymbiotica]CAQ82962.1 conserved hypothetical protein [Photorhabdus asymbiotica]
MKRDIVLSIVVVAGIAVGGIASAAATEALQASKIENKSPTSTGKCASGKCGTEKIYGQAELKHDPQDQLVRSRDGKCGLSGKGIGNKESPQQVENSKCVNGICGK